MLLQVQPKDSYDVDAGRYEATCVDAREIEKNTKKGRQRFLRLTWELQVSGSENVRYLVGKNYDPSLSKNSVLRNDLITWSGDDINTREFDTATLKGKDATITVQHIHNDGFDEPFRWVARVEPPSNETANSFDV